ncbi:MAG: AAA family ATPase [Sumerlaeia bacterium]
MQYRIRKYERIEAKTQGQRAFFGEATDRLVVRKIQLNILDLVMISRGLSALLADWQVIREAVYDEYSPVSLSQQAVQVAPDQYDYVLKEGRQYWESAEGHRMTVDYDCEEERSRSYSEAEFAVPRERYDWLLELLEKLRLWIDANHFMRRQAFGADGEFLKLDDAANWNNVLIPDDVRSRLEAECIQLFKHADLFRANGVPLRRGIILYGPPGTGKTMIGRLLAKMCGVTFILITPGMLSNPAVLRQAFNWGRRFGPAILFFEDFDLVAGDGHQSGGGGLLGEFLSCLDGVDMSEGIVAIATTNDLNAIEPALRERPNRFDCILQIPPLSQNHRIAYLAQWLERHPNSEVNIERVAKKANNYTGAQMQELCRQGVMAAVEEHLSNAENNHAKALPLTDAHFDQAFKRSPEKQFRPMGFHADGDG